MKNLFWAFLVLWSTEVKAQGTVEDYRRAYSLYEKFNSSHVSGLVSDVRWQGVRECTFRMQTENGKELRRLTCSDDGKWHVEPVPNREGTKEQRPGGRRKEVREDARNNGTLQGPQLVRNHWMNVDDERTGAPVISPDSTLKAYIKNENIYVSDREGKNERALSNDGTLANYYSSYIQWSPDGRYVCANKIRPAAQKRYVYYVESSPTTQLQPILHQQEYAKPGDDLMQKTPCIFEVATGRACIPTNELFPIAYEIWGPQWKEDSSGILFDYNQRGHQVFRVLELNAQTGKVRTVVEERSDKYINYSRYVRIMLDEGRKMIWMSERDGWAHLYLVDVEKGKIIRQITKGEWEVREVVHIDEEQQTILFSANGMTADEDPYLLKYYRIGMDGKNLVCLTPEQGNHSVTFSPDYAYFVDNYSLVNQAPVTVLRSVNDAAEIVPLATADLTALTANGWVAPEVFVAPGRDGKTPMWGIIQRPTNFDPNHRYPVIEYIYSGPGDNYVPKSFHSYNWNMTALAELGFIVVQLDAMGTSHRGKKFEEVCYKNLKDAGFPDRIAWIKAAAEKYPYMDADNVGIYGCSAGGQESTTAVLLHGDFYKAAYSACGCHDNRMDKIWWNEQWMGWPVDSSYVACSNVENAHLLERPLMLVVGECDDNVDPASTMQVANALIRANKDFELVVIPGAHHTMGESFGEHKRYDFFVRHLLHITPPAWKELEQE